MTNSVPAGNKSNGKIEIAPQPLRLQYKLLYLAATVEAFGNQKAYKVLGLGMQIIRCHSAHRESEVGS